MKLYEVNDRIEYLLANCVDEQGALTEETAQMLDELEDEREEKLLNIALYLRGEMVEGEAVAAEAQRLAARAKIHLNRSAWLKEYLAENMAEDEKIQDPRVRVSFRRSTAVEIEDPDTVPASYIITSTEERIDKKLVREALKDGKEVPGCRLATRWNLQVK